MAIAIGDIHGCLETLERLIHRLPHDRELIFLGDYIDRGPDSAGVIRYLKRLSSQRPCRFLRGNHEALLASALVDSNAITSWMINGGADILSSYGVQAHRWAQTPQRGAFLREDAEFLENLLPYVETEEFIFTHAGVDMAIPAMEEQDENVLIWIREPFFLHGERWKGKNIVFGHTPTRTMGLKGKEIFRSHRLFGIDTGCVYGGYLTALDTETQTLYQEPSDFSC